MAFLRIFSTYLLIILIVYGKLPFTFFQQDEWAIFGNFLYWDKGRLDWTQRIFTYSKTHLIPLTDLVAYFQFKLLGVNFFLYGVSAIMIHLVNSLLVYYLLMLLTRKKILAFLAGLLFLSNSISHQGFTWIATTVGTAASVSFILLALIFFTKYIIGEGSKIQYIVLSIVFFIISLFFKETSIFLFFFYPVLWFIYKENKNFLTGIKLFIPFFIFGFLYVLLRIYFLISDFTSTNAGIEYSQPGIMVYLYRVFSSPLKFIAQSILPQELVIKIADLLIMLGYPIYPNFLSGNVPNPYISQSIGVDIVSYFFSVTIILISIVLSVCFKIKKENYMKKVLFLSIIFVALSSLPFIFIPGRAGYFSLIDGRHLYISGVFTSMLLVILGFGFYTVFKRKRGVALVLMAIYIVFFLFHVKKIRTDINHQVGTAFIRKSIINKIYNSYPNLSRKVAFYIEGDRPYYGLPQGENIIPFQSGFGQTLLVWYNAHGQTFPSCFFKDKFFYDLLAQGYRECEGRGFGYFRKHKDLITAIQREDFYSQDIVAFKYDSSSKLLVDITQDLRKELKNE